MVMRTLNRASKAAGNREVFVVTDGPEENFAVMDLTSAIELGGGYIWEGSPSTFWPLSACDLRETL